MVETKVHIIINKTITLWEIVICYIKLTSLCSSGCLSSSNETFLHSSVQNSKIMSTWLVTEVVTMDHQLYPKQSIQSISKPEIMLRWLVTCDGSRLRSFCFFEILNIGQFSCAINFLLQQQKLKFFLRETKIEV